MGYIPEISSIQTLGHVEYEKIEIKSSSGKVIIRGQPNLAPPLFIKILQISSLTLTISQSTYGLSGSIHKPDWQREGGKRN